MNIKQQSSKLLASLISKNPLEISNCVDNCYKIPKYKINLSYHKLYLLNF